METSVPKVVATVPKVVATVPKCVPTVPNNVPRHKKRAASAALISLLSPLLSEVLGDCGGEGLEVLEVALLDRGLEAGALLQHGHVLHA